MTTNVNEDQIIEFLKQREQLLQEELEKIRATINVIDSSSIILNKQLVSNVSTTENSSGSKKSVSKILKPINDFPEKGKLDDKISFALTKVKKAYKEDILKVLIENQPTLDVVKLQNAVGVRLSYLLKNDMLSAKKYGRKFKYSLH